MSPYFVTLVSIAYADELPQDRDLLFESQCSLSLDHASEIYAYIIDAFFKQVQMRNNINLSVIILRKVRLKMLREYKQDEYFLIEAYHVDLAITN